MGEGGMRLEGCRKMEGNIWKNRLEILRKMTGHFYDVFWKTGVPKCISRRDLPVPGMFSNVISNVLFSVLAWGTLVLLVFFGYF